MILDRVPASSRFGWDGRNGHDGQRRGRVSLSAVRCARARPATNRVQRDRDSSRQPRTSRLEAARRPYGRALTGFVVAGIFLNKSGRLVALIEGRYETEAVLQELIAQHPETLAGERGGALLLVRREAAVYDDQDVNAHGSLDHLFLDSDGVPVLVEVKRSTDTRIRREVVGQMLDYATGAANWKVEQLQAWLSARCDADGLNADDVLGDHTSDPDGFWLRVHDNLRGRHLRLVFVADVIPGTLRAIVEFLNEQLTDCEVLAVEVKQYLDPDGRQTIVVPTVLGDTEKAKETKGKRRVRRWTRDSVMADLAARCTTSEHAVADRILAWADRRGDLTWSCGHGAVDGSIQCGIDDGQRRIFPFVIYSNGAVEIPFARMAAYQPFADPALREQYREKLNTIGLDTPLPPQATEKRPSIALAGLAKEGIVDAFVAALDWALAQPTDGV